MPAGLHSQCCAGSFSKTKAKEKSMPLGVMTAASVPRSSPRQAYSQEQPLMLHWSLEHAGVMLCNAGVA